MAVLTPSCDENELFGATAVPLVIVATSLAPNGVEYELFFKLPVNSDVELTLSVCKNEDKVTEVEEVAFSVLAGVPLFDEYVSWSVKFLLLVGTGNETLVLPACETFDDGDPETIRFVVSTVPGICAGELPLLECPEAE